MSKQKVVKLAVLGVLIGVVFIQLKNQRQESRDNLNSANRTIYESCLLLNESNRELGLEGKDRDCEAQAMGFDNE